MKILVVMDAYPLPMRTGGAIVGFHAMEQLARRHEIDFFCLSSEGDGAELAEIVSHVTLIRPEISSVTRRAMRLFSRLLFRIFPNQDWRGDRNLRTVIAQRMREHRFDAILLFEMGAIKHLPRQLLSRLAVNIEDPQSLRLSRTADLPVWSRASRLKIKILAALTRRYEQAVLPQLAKVFLLSKRDIEDFRVQGNHLNLAHVSYGVMPKATGDIKPYASRRKIIVYTGNMFHPPNIDGALHFLEDIFPHVLRMESTAKVFIVGAEPDRRIFQAAKRYGASVEITGRVASLASYLETALVSICPVRLEIGVQTKILESLSYGTPVVTTIAGNRGIGATSGMHLHAVDDAELFAQKVCGLLRGENWPALSANGLQFVTDHFSWTESARQLETHLATLSGSGE